MPNFGLTFAGITLLAAVPIGAQQSRDFAPYMMARDAEVAMARSSAPKSISDSARVLVLTRTGYVEAARGTNGFTCLVLRSFSGRTDDPDFWNPRVRAPHCFNPPGARTALVEIVKGAEWILAGASPAERAARAKRAYASHQFLKPAPGSMVYMMSPQQYLLDANPHWLPHVMFLYDKSLLPPSTWGPGDPASPIIDGSAGDLHTEVQIVIVPVRKWSDGSPALPAPAAGEMKH